MVSERIQWIIVVLLALILLLVGVICYNKDNYFYDFALEGNAPQENPYIRKFFEDTGGDVDQSITTRRKLIACEKCMGIKQTPNACQACHSYVKGNKFIKEGVM
uniref:Uncharacterized protein n=1 Tax=viral metagenome TaxID=1070528 RepID=A0A6C0KQF9_9ZZZZ